MAGLDLAIHNFSVKLRFLTGLPHMSSDLIRGSSAPMKKKAASSGGPRRGAGEVWIAPGAQRAVLTINPSGPFSMLRPCAAAMPESRSAPPGKSRAISALRGSTDLRSQFWTPGTP